MMVSLMTLTAALAVVLVVIVFAYLWYKLHSGGNHHGFDSDAIFAIRSAANPMYRPVGSILMSTSLNGTEKTLIKPPFPCYTMFRMFTVDRKRGVLYGIICGSQKAGKGNDLVRAGVSDGKLTDVKVLSSRLSASNINSIMYLDKQDVLMGIRTPSDSQTLQISLCNPIVSDTIEEYPFDFPTSSYMESTYAVGENTVIVSTWGGIPTRIDVFDLNNKKWTNQFSSDTTLIYTSIYPRYDTGDVFYMFGQDTSDDNGCYRIINYDAVSGEEVANSKRYIDMSETNAGGFVVANTYKRLYATSDALYTTDSWEAVMIPIDTLKGVSITPTYMVWDTIRLYGDTIISGNGTDIVKWNQSSGSWITITESKIGFVEVIVNERLAGYNMVNFSGFSSSTLKCKNP